jgi:hypothetical protein
MTDIIEKILDSSENVYLITIIFLLIITIFVSVIGISCLNMVTNTEYTESGEANNIIIIMDSNIQRIMVFLYILLTILVGSIVYILYQKYYNNPKYDLTSIYYFMAFILFIGAISGVMLKICNDIKTTVDTKSTDNEINATANDKITVQSAVMSTLGVASSLVLFYALYVFYKDKKLFFDIKKSLKYKSPENKV